MRIGRTALCRELLRYKPVSQVSRLPIVRWSTTSTRKWSTPLAKNLGEAIAATGPIPVAAYMRQCLTSPDGGYYTTKSEGQDQFGQKGDFITSPEISQLFGELVGIWVVAEWIAQGRKRSGVQLIEIGPGRGTLMDDMLRTMQNFKPMMSSIEAVYMIEASPSLREAQKTLLCGDAPMEETTLGFQSKCKYGNNINIHWCEDIRYIPKNAEESPFIIAHEFFDALPIHIFQSVPSLDQQSKIVTSSSTSIHPVSSKANQWRELLVTPTPNPLLSTTSSSDATSKADAEFQLILSKTATPHSLYLPEISSRYQNLKTHSDSIIEISPESQTYASDIAARIGGGISKPAQSHTSQQTSKAAPVFKKPAPSGAALILDYGPSSTIPTNSLRGIWKHALVSPFSHAGQIDLSVDVDFHALAEAAINASPGIEVHGPVEQGHFLLSMGIKERAKMLIQNSSTDKKDDEKRKRIEESWKRLVDQGPTGMGRIYKAMAIVPHRSEQNLRRPVGFGGDV